MSDNNSDTPDVEVVAQLAAIRAASIKKRSQDREPTLYPVITPNGLVNVTFAQIVSAFPDVGESALWMRIHRGLERMRRRGDKGIDGERLGRAPRPYQPRPLPYGETKHKF